MARHHDFFPYPTKPRYQVTSDALLPQYAAGIVDLKESTRTQAWKEAAGLTAKPALLALENPQPFGSSSSSHGEARVLLAQTTKPRLVVYKHIYISHSPMSSPYWMTLQFWSGGEHLSTFEPNMLHASPTCLGKLLAPLANQGERSFPQEFRVVHPSSQHMSQCGLGKPSAPFSKPR